MRNGTEKQNFLLEKIKEISNLKMTISDWDRKLKPHLFYDSAFLESGKPKKKKIFLFETEKSFRRAMDGLVSRGLLKKEISKNSGCKGKTPFLYGI